MWPCTDFSGYPCCLEFHQHLSYLHESLFAASEQEDVRMIRFGNLRNIFFVRKHETCALTSLCHKGEWRNVQGCFRRLANKWRFIASINVNLNLHFSSLFKLPQNSKTSSFRRRQKIREGEFSSHYELGKNKYILGGRASKSNLK